MIDFDNFKTYNDRHGHAAGDDLLKAVAQAIRESIRTMDVPARFGGDEFATLLPDMTLDEGIVVARRLTEAARRGAFAVPGGTIEPSVSVGVAAYPESDPADAKDLLERADAALYVVKKSGSKGTVVASRPDREPRLL
jgi:diguanylate cyclase (GGDEF)-like protein